MNSEFVESPFQVLMTFHFLRQELATSIVMHPFNVIPCMGFKVGLISFVGFKGLILHFQEVKLHFMGMVIHSGCRIEVSALTTDCRRSP